MADTTIPLSKPYTVHEKTFTEVVLREPTYLEIFMDGLGRPVEWQPSKSGPMQIVYPDIVDAYVRKLIVAPGYDMVIGLSSVDALKLERAVCDFFQDWKTSNSSSG